MLTPIRPSEITKSFKMHVTDDILRPGSLVERRVYIGLGSVVPGTVYFSTEGRYTWFNPEAAIEIGAALMNWGLYQSEKAKEKAKTVVHVLTSREGDVLRTMFLDEIVRTTETVR